VRRGQWAAHWRYSRAVPFARCRGTNLPGLNGRNALMLCSVGGVLHSPSATHLPRRTYLGALGLNAPGYFVRLTLTPCRWERDLLSMSCEMRASIPLPASRADPGPIRRRIMGPGFRFCESPSSGRHVDMSLSNGAPRLCVPGPVRPPRRGPGLLPGHCGSPATSPYVKPSRPLPKSESQCATSLSCCRRGANGTGGLVSTTVS
jgi:hypothetical protein